MNKRTLATVLVGLNLFLIVALIFTAYEPPAARAQTLGVAGNFVMLAGKAESNRDVVYLLDLRNRNIHAIGADRVGARAGLRFLGTRSLVRDLGR